MKAPRGSETRPEFQVICQDPVLQSRPGPPEELGCELGWQLGVGGWGGRPLPTEAEAPATRNGSVHWDADAPTGE